MAHFVGLDVSVKETAVCVVDEVGEVVSKQKVPTEPDDIVTLLTSIGEAYDRGRDREADLRAPVSGFRSIASASPQRADPAPKTHFRWLLTQNCPADICHFF